MLKLFMLDDGRIRIGGSIQIMTDPDPGGPKTSGSGSTTRIFPNKLFVERIYSCLSTYCLVR
jgi:hypothetical protein